MWGCSRSDLAASPRSTPTSQRSAFGSSGTFTIEVQLLHVQNASSGTCKVTLNDKTDASAAYTVAGNKFSLQTNLNPTPIDIYVSQGGTQFDGVSGHNLWIGQWS